ncbi:MAG: aldehyde dehydrogenase family protein, partial [Roseovarius sp.]
MPYDISTTRADLIIHGERVPARSGRSFETLNPATEQPLAQVAEAGVEDVNDAVASARKALTGDWGR